MPPGKEVGVCRDASHWKGPFSLTNLVLLHKSNSKYNDQPERHYHFPNRSYLKAMKEAVGEGIVYFEPQGKGAATPGRHVYFAAARIDRIDPDPEDPNHSYARITDYFDFPELVHFRRLDGTHYESKLQQPDGSTNRGLRQRAVRRIDAADFYSIRDAGMKIPEHLQLSISPSFSDSHFSEVGFSEYSFSEFGFSDSESLDRSSFSRAVVPLSGNRKVRDPLFRAAVLRSYDSCCAFTDLKILNGGNRAEVDAAHIVPVGHNHQGNDSVRNGLALSKTMHWLFDRGILAVGDDYRIMESPGRLPDKIRPLFRPSGMIREPKIPGERPNPEYLRYHRQMFEGDYGEFRPLAVTQ